MSASADPRDLYKAILLLQSLPPSFARTRDSGFAKLLSPCGERDNMLGGLFGKANFLGETFVAKTLDVSSGLSQPVDGTPPGQIPPTGWHITFQTPGPFWAAVLYAKSSDAKSFTFAAMESLPSGIDIRDNQYFNTTLGSWQSAIGNCGITVGANGGSLSVTVAQVEAAFASSGLVGVQTPDFANAAQLFQEDVPAAGAFVVTGQDRSAIDQARDSMFVNTASGKFLTDLGGNYGVPRPPQSPFDDELFRRIIPVLAWLPKTPLLVTYKLAEVIFGTQAQVAIDQGFPWQIYEVNPNEIIFECPLGLIAGNTEVGSYMHGYPGTTGAVTGPTNTITNIGSDARLSVSGSNLSGRTLYIFFSGAWQTYTISSSSYNAGTQTNTFILSASTVPTGDSYPFFIDVPGGNSWNPGDFMLADATIPAGGTHPPHDDLVYLFGKARLDIFEFYMNNFVRAAGVSLRTEVL